MNWIYRLGERRYSAAWMLNFISPGRRESAAPRCDISHQIACIGTFRNQRISGSINTLTLWIETALFIAHALFTTIGEVWVVGAPRRQNVSPGSPTSLQRERPCHSDTKKKTGYRSLFYIFSYCFSVFQFQVLPVMVCCSCVNLSVAFITIQILIIDEIPLL